MAYGQILGQMQGGDIESIARIINAGWVRIAKWETAGNYTWEAPDLFGGKPYQIGVVVIGGGGSGGAAGAYHTTTSRSTTATGGSTGYSKNLTINISPLEQIKIEVGQGGKAEPFVLTSIINNKIQKGSNGRISRVTFNDKITTVNFGIGGNAVDIGFSGHYLEGVIGGQSVANTKSNLEGYYGGVYVPINKDEQESLIKYFQNKQVPSNVGADCYNHFTNQFMLSAGCSAYAEGSDSSHDTFALKTNNEWSGGFGTAVVGQNTQDYTISAGNGKGPGSGGGAAVLYIPNNSYNYTATVSAGSGADGAVYIYTRGVDPDKYAV